MQRLHPEQQNSSLGISKALQEEVRMIEDAENSNTGGPIVKKSLTDAMFKVPTKEANFFTWARFYISLYYNKVCVCMCVIRNCIFCTKAESVGCQLLWMSHRMEMV